MKRRRKLVNENSIIKVENLSKIYEVPLESKFSFKNFLNKEIKTINAIKNFNLNVKKGETIGLIGMNGAGKTTLIKMLTGILTPNEGKIEILGFSPQKNRYKYTSHIGLVMGQKSLLWFNVPVEESLKLYKEIYSLTDEEYRKKIDEFDKVFSIKELLKIPVRKLSLGQRMKCEIVASLLHNPKVLFLDEPTIGLDILSKNYIYNLLEKMKKNFKTTIIITTHNLEEVEKLCQRVVLIDKGLKIYDGKLDKLLELNTKKDIVITTKDEIGELEGMVLLEKNKYQLECEKEKIPNLINKLSSIKELLDLKIKNKNLNHIISEIYNGELNL